ncbi:hypothetical protein BMS3Abin05_00755 [bacterium BMS3Abin05]|nr:hypothetical protein BMS3Abin05_00755 [bacterium BMS3Abin05]GBE28602.1 hypothetical protein BMS3Bbin03_02550 [bacterium BMS3Bbin03]
MSKSLSRSLVGFFSVVMLVFFVAGLLFAGVTGKINGVVKDKTTGEPLPGANIMIKGTQMGASTDQKGRYFIINVPPGKYTLQALFIGYQTVQKTNVMVTIDATTEVDFALSSRVISGKAVTVVAERPLVQKTLTQSKYTVSAAELDNVLPVANVQGIIETAASTFHGYVRGGRKFSTKIIIDGVDVTDNYYTGGTGAFGTGDVGFSYQGYRESETDQSATISVPSSAIQEMVVYAGTFTAEYPTAAAGIVNIVTKMGGAQYHGKLFMRGTPLNTMRHFGTNVYWMKGGPGQPDGYFNEKERYLASGTPYGERAASLYTWTDALAKDKYYYNPDDSTGLGRSIELVGDLSGPVPFLGKKANFFLSARFSHERPTPMPFDVNQHINVGLKLDYRFTADKRLMLYGQVVDGGKLFHWVNWKFNPKWAYYMQGAPRYKDLSVMSYAKWIHQLSDKTFYTIQLSYNGREDWTGYPDDNGDGFSQLNEKGDFIKFSNRQQYLKYVGGVIKVDTLRNKAGDIIGYDRYIDPSSANGYKPGHFGDPKYRVFFYSATDPASGVNEAKANFYKVDGWYKTHYPTPLYIDTRRDATVLKADFTSQVTYNHLVKTGLLFRYNNIYHHLLQSPLGGAGHQYPTSLFWVDYTKFNPKEFAYYLQDRIEYKGMIINVGGRVDGYNVDTRYFKNDFHPFDVIRTPAPSSQLLEYRPVRDGKIGWKWFFSPRIGVSHPVSDKMAMHYSFGKFIQYPNYSSLYQDYNFTNYAMSPTIYTKWVDQEPIRATSYEMGLQYAPLSDLGIDISAYYRDVSNYSSISYSLTPYAGSSLTFATTWGHADARGIELTLTKRPSKWWSGRLTYSFSYIKSAIRMSSKDPNQRQNFSAKKDSAAFGGKLPWDWIDHHNYREQDITVRSTSNALAGGYDRTHRFAATLIVYLPYGVQLSSIGDVTSGFKYRPLENTKHNPYFNITPGINTGPWNYHVNVRLTKLFRFGQMKMSVFGEVRNITNHENILAFNNTPFMEAKDQIIFELTGNPEGVRNVPHDAFGRMLYGSARQLWAGLQFSF